MTTPVVRFACVHDGGRSLAGEVLTEHDSAGAVEARSAGSEPGDPLDPGVVAVLAERGLSTDGEHPEPLTSDGVQGADIASRWVAARLQDPASACRTGSSRTPRARTSRPCAASSTTSTPGSATCSTSSASGVSSR